MRNARAKDGRYLLLSDGITVSRERLACRPAALAYRSWYRRGTLSAYSSSPPPPYFRLKNWYEMAYRAIKKSVR